MRDFFRQHKPVATICHAPITLIEAVVCDEGMVTSRSTDDLDAFCATATEEFVEGKQAEQTV